MMKQLIILSGKGGTGKTSVSAAFAHLAAESPEPLNCILADADVDASNLELVLNPTVHEEHEFWGGQVAIIDPGRCEGCGACFRVCRFDAIAADTLPEPPIVDPVACDGCAACVYQCPTEAIHMEPQLAGHWYRSTTPYGPLVHAALLPAQENSGKLVTLVKQQARMLELSTGSRLMLVDGPPGIGCPVISTASGADLALLVTEPTLAGAHDMDRALQTTRHFNVPALVCINKADLYPAGADAIEDYCRRESVELVGRIPFDPAVTQAMVAGRPVTTLPDSPAAAALREIWSRVLAALDLAPSQTR